MQSFLNIFAGSFRHFTVTVAGVRNSVRIAACNIAFNSTCSTTTSPAKRCQFFAGCIVFAEAFLMTTISSNKQFSVRKECDFIFPP